MIKNYSLKDAFRSLEEINDELIETSIIINGPLTEGYKEELKEDISNANIKAFDIIWDTDGEPITLPKEMYLELDEDELSDDEGVLEENIANKLSDETGWLVDSFNYEKIEPKDVTLESMNEEIFSLSDEDGLKDIEKFENEEENEVPELKIIDTNADEIDEVASNEEVAGSFVFTCDKCGESIFRTLDELKDAGYERLDDTEKSQFKLRNKDVSDGEFYRCSKCGGEIWNGDKQIVLADVDKEVSGEETIPETPVEEENVIPEEPVRPEEAEEVLAVEESLEKKDLTESAEITDDDIIEDYLSDKLAKVLDDYGIMYGDIVDYGRSCHIVGVDEEEWEEAQAAIKNELGLTCTIPDYDHEEYDDELVVYEECLKEALSQDKLSEFRKDEFFKDFNDTTIRKFINSYLDFIDSKDHNAVTVDEVKQFMTEEGLGLFALDNYEALRYKTFKELGKRDPKFIQACTNYYPVGGDDFEDADELIDITFDEKTDDGLRQVIADIKKEYLKLDESKEDNNDKPDLKEGFKKKENGQTFWSKDGEEWEECTQEEYDECGYEDVSESLNEEIQESGDVLESGEEKEPETFEDKMDVLAKDEQEAIEGYDEIIPTVEDEHVKDQLEKIKTEEEAHQEYLEKVKEDPTIDYVEPLESGEEEPEEDEYSELTITGIEENSLDKAISEKLSEMFENFASYKTETAVLKDVENRIVLEGNLTFTSNKEQKVNLILEAIECEDNKIKFKLLSEDFEDINTEVNTILNEGLLEAEDKEDNIIVGSGDWRISWNDEDLKDIESEKIMKFESKEEALDWIGYLDYLQEFDLDNDQVKIYNIKTNEEEKVDLPTLHKSLTEASSAEKNAYRDGGKELDDYIQGKAIARIKDSKAREAAIAAKKAGRDDVVKFFTGDRKENQAERSFEKKATKMQKAGLTESDDWKSPEECETFEEYLENEPEYLSNARSQIENGLLDADNISEDDERDYAGDPDNYIGTIITRAAWDAQGNDAECKLALEWAEREYPNKVKVIRKYLA